MTGTRPPSCVTPRQLTMYVYQNLAKPLEDLIGTQGLSENFGPETLSHLNAHIRSEVGNFMNDN